MAYAKAGRKQYGAGSKTFHQPVIETNEDGAGSMATKGDGKGGDCQVDSAPTMVADPRIQIPGVGFGGGGDGGSSPVNRSGVHILIDGSSDVEGDDEHSKADNDNLPSYTGVNNNNRENIAGCYTNNTSSSSSPEATAAAIAWRKTVAKNDCQASDERTLPTSIHDGNLTDSTEEDQRQLADESGWRKTTTDSSDRLISDNRSAADERSATDRSATDRSATDDSTANNCTSGPSKGDRKVDAS